ncbi:MAG: uroporphyrinogen-III synthase [Pseudomonadota bacterium]
MTEVIPVIITRAEPGAGETAQRVREMGLRPVLSPMLALDAMALDDGLNMETAAGLVFTSANGVRFHAARFGAADITAWCVGPATELAAKRAGFSCVRTAHGDSDTLRAFIADHADPKDGPLFHVANVDAAGQLAEGLRHSGFDVVFAPLYRTVPAAKFSAKARAVLSDVDSGVLLVHSAKGAAAADAALSDQNTSAISLVVVSENAARPLTRRDWAAISIAESPNEDALLTALAEII